jgi:hypothetical protein
MDSVGPEHSRGLFMHRKLATDCEAEEKPGHELGSKRSSGSRFSKRLE